jgi:class 3 adenylate cyclase/tetratricopeptide (TPR) repeat protein
MECPRCRAENSPSSLFCDACGNPLGPTCAACAHANRHGSRFCARCGAPLSAAPAATADQVLRTLASSGGERKRVTVLFADMRGSTALIERIDPEEAMRRFQPVLAAMRDAVHRYEGAVVKVQGDGIMALFGAPRPQEDHPVRGCLAALAMRDAIAKLGDPDVHIRVGLHTGEVVVQAVENSLTQTYDAAGATVHLASRMEQMASEAGILLTADTFAAARQFVDAEPLGAQAVRGLSAPVEIFRLNGLKHAPVSALFRTGLRLTPLAGREQELAALDLELARAIEGEGRVVGLVGEAGLGKSRLCFEFAETCRRRGVRVFEARVLAHGRATPLQPVLGLLRDAFGIQPNEPAEVSRARVVAEVRARGDFSEALPVLLEFLGLPDPEHPAPKLDPTARKLRLLSFVRQFVRARPRDQPVVVLVEDLHWIDAASEEFIDALVDAVVGTKTLMVVNFRPGYAAEWMQRSHYRQISLGRLDSADAASVLSDLLGPDPSLALLGRSIAERAQGNPFFLEELVRSLADRGDFEGGPGAYRLKGGIGAIPLPATVEAVIGARIDRLEGPTKHVLQVAAVIGREVPLAILNAVAGISASEMDEALRQLRRAEMLYELPLHEPGLHAFRHPLIQEAAYRALLLERRRELHAAVARAMEAHYRDRLDERAGLLAFHLEQAGEIVQAAQANVRAAVWVGANDPSQALRSWRKVRDLLGTQKPDPMTNYLRMMACGQIVNFGWREGIAAEEARLYFEEARALAVNSGDMRANALIHAAYGRVLAASGSADEYVAKLREAKTLAGSADASLAVTLNAVLCHALRLSGRLREALAVNTEALGHAGELGTFERQMLGFDLQPWLLAMRGQTLVALGRGEEARADLDRVIAMEPTQVDVTHHVVPSIAYVELAWATGDAAVAEQHAERAFSMALKSGSPYLRVYAMGCRGLAHLTAGRLDRAIEEFMEAIGFARRRKAGLENEARMLADLAGSYGRKGEWEAARTTAAEAIEVATARSARVPECLARIVHAETLWAAGDPTAAEAELDRARRLMEETGAELFRPLLDAARARPAGAADSPGKAMRAGAA